MFTPESRARLRDALIADAHDDERISGAALTGSAAVGREDRWSDIDLALCVAEHDAIDAVVADWTGRMYRERGTVHHFDVYRGATLFRVFLLADTLQVDIAFWPANEFGAIGPTFRLLFGQANEIAPTPGAEAGKLAGMAWVYALHARSSIARGRVWQAEYMISGMRDQVLAMACLRHGVPDQQGRGMDDLPAAVTGAVAAGLVRSPDVAELRRSFGVVTEALVTEIRFADPELAGRLAGPLRELAGG